MKKAIFDNNVPKGIDYTEHLDNLGIEIAKLQNEIWRDIILYKPQYCRVSREAWGLLKRMRCCEIQSPYRIKLYNYNLMCDLDVSVAHCEILFYKDFYEQSDNVLGKLTIINLG